MQIDFSDTLGLRGFSCPYLRERGRTAGRQQSGAAGRMAPTDAHVRIDVASETPCSVGLEPVAHLNPPEELGAFLVDMR